MTSGRSASGTSTSPRRSSSVRRLHVRLEVSFACAWRGLRLARIARIKADKHPAFAMHWLYWHLPTSPMTAMRATPPSHIRRMVG
jgi:type IV conjugative transfer system protein TraL